MLDQCKCFCSVPYFGLSLYASCRKSRRKSRNKQREIVSFSLLSWVLKKRVIAGTKREFFLAADSSLAVRVDWEFRGKRLYLLICELVQGGYRMSETGPNAAMSL